MIDPQRHLEAIIGGPAPPPAFPASSRYHATPTTQTVLGDGRVVAHLRRRLVPAPERFAAFREHRVVEGDRLDRIAAEHLGDPELFWRLCDANGALRPDELTAVLGRGLRVTLPQDVPGAPDAG